MSNINLVGVQLLISIIQQYVEPVKVKTPYKIECHSDEDAVAVGNLCDRSIVLGSAVITDEKFLSEKKALKALSHVSNTSEDVSSYDWLLWRNAGFCN